MKGVTRRRTYGNVWDYDVHDGDDHHEDTCYHSQSVLFIGAHHRHHLHPSAQAFFAVAPRHSVCSQPALDHHRLLVLHALLSIHHTIDMSILPNLAITLLPIDSINLSVCFMPSSTPSFQPPSSRAPPSLILSITTSFSPIAS